MISHLSHSAPQGPQTSAVKILKQSVTALWHYLHPVNPRGAGGTTLLLGGGSTGPGSSGDRTKVAAEADTL